MIQASNPSQLRGERVFVYRNLHKDCWSVRSQRTGRVVAHADRVELSDAAFKVSQAGRERVLREKRKNVHAGVAGTLESFVPLGRAYPSARYTVGGSASAPAPVTYNPYRYETFVIRGTEQPIHSADRVVLEPDRNVWAFAPGTT